MHPTDHRRSELTELPVASSPSPAAALESDLKQQTSAEVRFDRGSRGAYSTDASNYRQIPIGVVVPKTVEDAVTTVALCHHHGAPITSRGGGTSLAGQCCNVAVVIDWSKYLHHVIEIDPDKQLARIQPGCNLDTLREAAQKHGLTFGPDPATHNRNTLGGMIGNNSCGIHSVMAQFYGPGPLTSHNVESLEILTYEGQRMTVGATSEEELVNTIQQGGPRGEIYQRLRTLRDGYSSLIRERYPHIPRRVSGYNLNELLPENGFQVARALVGTEGTCVTVLEATVRLIEHRPQRTLLVLGYPSVYEAGDHVPTIMEHRPVGLEGLDDKLVHFMKLKGLHPDDVQLLPEGKGWLLVEFGGETKGQAEQQAHMLIDRLKQEDDPPSIKLFDKSWEESKLWEVRESGLGATSHVPNMPEAHPGWEDAGVPPDQVGGYLREFRKLLNEFDYEAALYGHFGQGCIHCRISFDLKSESGIADYRKFIDRAADLVVRHGGSLSGEHGDGQARAALLAKMYGEDLVEAFRRFKTIWDPQGRMNPGKVVDPYLPTENLKYSPENYHPQPVDTYFRFPDDGGSFAAAANRCVGVGKCRRTEHGTMCPSYMATREEEDSTRGRARMLFEMLQGDVIVDGWRDDNVREALDLCLACKGCKNECPVNVDMATYKAEFLAHYYEGRLRPATAYAMGWIYWWARVASKLPRVTNFFSQTPPFANLLKWLGGIAPQRNMPAFATQTFRRWFSERGPRSPSVTARQDRRDRSANAEMQAGSDDAMEHENVPRFQSDTYNAQPFTQRLNPHAGRLQGSDNRVLLWPDTFNNYLLPDAAKAAVRVLEHAGFAVSIPPRPLCCGRPLYDYGMLKAAKKLWWQILETLKEDIDRGIPLVGLEPSCVAAFRDELINFFPGDGRGKRLSQQTYLFSEFLVQEDYQPPKLHRKALVHGHCQHKAVMHMDAEVALLKKLGLDYQLLDSGCCGMAGSFGFEKEKYDVSVQIGERVLLPAVRDADEEILIIANGFSCREQIQQCTGRKATHIAEVVQLAIEQASARLPEPVSTATAASH